MKILRTSFPQLIREKIYSGEDVLLPDPTPFQGIRTHQTIQGFDSEDFLAGHLTYRESDTMHSDSDGNTWLTQGPTGYGDVPTGPGTKPYYTTVNNAKRNTTVDMPGVYTGSTPGTGPDVYYAQNIPGPFGYGYTYSVGQLKQTYTPANDPTTSIDVKLPPGRHVLFTLGNSLYGGLRTENQLTSAGIAANNPYDMYSNNDPNNNIDWDQNNCLHFIYEETAEKQFKLYVRRGKSVNNSNQVADIDSYPNVTLPQTDPNVQIHDCYGRFMPVHLIIRPDGTGEFRVDTGKIQFNINQMPGNDGSLFRMVNGTTVHNGGCWLAAFGLQTRHYTAAPQQGMERPIVVMANLAINNSDDSDNLGDTGIPPFIAGVPMTPIRRQIIHDHTDNERPKDVVDQHKQSTGDDAWIAYRISGTAVDYNNALESVVDGQKYDIHGVAAQELSGSLDVVMDYDRVKSRWQATNNAIAATGIEAINVAVNNAHVFNTIPDEMCLGLAVEGDDRGQEYRAGWNKVGTAENIPYSHTMFLNKYHTGAQQLTGWSLDDFENDIVLRAQAMETAHL